MKFWRLTKIQMNLCVNRLASRDPDFITPVIKAKLRRKNKLMRAGRTGEAGALARLIGKEIMRNNNNRTKLSKVGNNTEAKNIWAAVRRLTGSKIVEPLPTH